MSEVTHRFKMILVGPGAVGKTSLLKRFVENTFSSAYKLTIGVDFLAKSVTFGEDVAKLTIWDIGGQKRFSFMRNRFYDGAHGALLVFDLSRAETYIKIKKWLTELRQFAGQGIPFILIGNKLDLMEQIGEVINRDEARKFAESEGSIYIETSAKTGDNVEHAFVELTKLMVKKGLEKGRF